MRRLARFEASSLLSLSRSSPPSDEVLVGVVIVARIGLDGVFGFGFVVLGRL